MQEIEMKPEVSAGMLPKTKTPEDKMPQNTKKKRIIAISAVVIIFIALIAAGTFVATRTNLLDRIPWLSRWLQEESASDNNTPQITRYYVDEQTPPNFAELAAEVLKSLEYEEAENLADADVTVYAEYTTDELDADLTREDSVSYYQVWVLTKPWTMFNDNSLTSRDPIPIECISNIDMYDPDLALGQSFQLDITTAEEPVSCETGLTLQTIQSLDSTQVPIAITQDPLDPETWKTDEHKDEYELKSTVTISGSKKVIKRVGETMTSGEYSAELAENHYLSELPVSEDFTRIIKTGTSVIGGPGWDLCYNTKGRIDYPIDDVKLFLSEADITIISNESSFVDGCTQSAGTTAFCGRPDYLQNLLDIGTDIISLTGNHMCDYGKTVFGETLETYTENDIEYFGGGANLDEAWKPLTFETSSGSIAFIGANKMGPDGVLATENQPGVAYYDEAELKAAIDEASAAGANLIWVDTHLWPEYGTTPGGDQTAVSQKAIDLGADIVTGVSSHQTQGMAFYKGKPVFYGLGNFLFDQMWSQETRQGMVLEATLYDGKIAGIDLYPTVMYDYCQPRFAQDTEKKQLIDYFVGISDL